jgi:hypothetical protein
MSYESHSAPFTFQHDTRAILTRYRRYSSSILQGIAEYEAGLPLRGRIRDRSYGNMLRIGHIERSKRGELRAMVNSGARTRHENFEARRQATIQAKAEAEKVTPEERLLDALGAVA